MPPVRKEDVVAPLWPKFVPVEEARRVVVRKPVPQPEGWLVYGVERRGNSLTTAIWGLYGGC